MLTHRAFLREGVSHRQLDGPCLAMFSHRPSGAVQSFNSGCPRAGALGYFLSSLRDAGPILLDLDARGTPAVNQRPSRDYVGQLAARRASAMCAASTAGRTACT